MAVFTEKWTSIVKMKKKIVTFNHFLLWKYTLKGQNMKKKNQLFLGSRGFLYAWNLMYFPLQNYCKKHFTKINL